MRFPEPMRKLTENVIPDVRDNFPKIGTRKSWQLSSAEMGPSGLEQLKERFFTKDQYQKLKSGAESFFEFGKLYECTWIVGERDKGTSHPHSFLGERTDTGTRFFFLDPEHNVARQNLLRPGVGNLIGVDLGNEYGNLKYTIIRFSTQNLSPTELKLQPQFEAARELLEKGSPVMLESHSDDVLFKVKIGDDFSMQARYTNDKKAKDFFRGGKGSRALRGKINANGVIINRMIEFLQSGRFEPAKRFK